MKAHIKLYICIIISALQILTAQAQLFHPKDSVRKQSILQLGMGGFLGINVLNPISEGFIYEIQNGYNQGILLQAYLNITPKFYLSSGYRWSQQTAVLGHRNNFFNESFVLKAERNAFPIILGYRISKYTFDVYFGATYNICNYTVTNVSYLNPLYKRVAKTGYEKYNNYSEILYTYLLGIKKNLITTKYVSVTSFLETDFSMPVETYNSLGINSAIDLTRFITKYKMYNFSIGVCLLFQYETH
jgi:riboflavin transporter FmnP